jgi:amidase
MAVAPEVEGALHDAARRLRDAGYAVEEVDRVPGFREPTRMQVTLWLGDNWPAFRAAIEAEGDEGALATLRAVDGLAQSLPPDAIARTLAERNAACREWGLFMERWPILLTPVSGALPFPDDEDLRGENAARAVLEAQLTQTGLPLMGLPGLVVSTGMVGTVPVGVQLIGARFREDVLLEAAEAIEAGGVPPMPAEPAPA